MSRPRSHPVFTVESNDSRCGHQHSDIPIAVHCAMSMVKPTTRWIHICSWNQDGNSKLIDGGSLRRAGAGGHTTEAGNCTECGRPIVMSERYELGHYDDCPIVSD